MYTTVALAAGCSNVYYETRTKTVLLSQDRTSYFYSNNLTGSTYTELKADGTYTMVDQEHMGVIPYDGGTWTQDGDGILTMVSTGRCSTVSAPPFEIYVGLSANTNCLPALRAQLAGFLATNNISKFSITDDENMPIFFTSDGEHGLQVDMIDVLGDCVATPAQLGRLISAIDRFSENPPAACEVAVPRTYMGRTFLVWLRRSLGPECALAEICRDIDQAKPGDVIPFHDFMVSEQQFEKGVGKPYSFRFCPEMNRVTGAE